MAQKSERKFGQIPVWATMGPITIKNFPYRAERYCAEKSDEREGMHPTVKKGMPEFDEWKRYFEARFGRYPWTFQMILDEENSEREYTVPELHPEWFDREYKELLEKRLKIGHG